MTSTILTTKLHIPLRRKNAVPRPQLVERLNLGLDGKLSLISAPAGFGKTTLVTEWLAQLPEDSHQVSWVSLDENDSEPVRFITYLVAAVRRGWPDFGSEVLASLTAPKTPNLEVLIHGLLNEWAENVHPQLLTLDDYHVVEDEAIHQLVNVLIDYAPPHLHFVLTSRDTPPLSLPRWRARGQLVEIQASDLRFSTSETQRFLNQTMGLSLEEPVITTIETHTEGWVAGLQLAAISLRGTKNPDIFMGTFTGRDRRVADYLLSEVLNRQDQETRDFLLQTSILERFNASLCAALLARENPSQVHGFLEELEATDLFIVPLDNERYWYRYHHLFAELLRQRLRVGLTPEEIAQLHLRAARWYESHQFYDEAIQQALQAGDSEYAARLITQIPLQSLWEHHTGSLMLGWAKELPESAIHKVPKAAVSLMFTLSLRGETDLLLHYLTLVKNDPTVEAERAIFESIIARNNGNIDQALQLVQGAATQLTDEEMPLKVMAFIQIANCQVLLGNLDEAKATLQDLHQWMPAGKGTLLNEQIQATDLQGEIAKIRGDYFLAHQFFQESLRLVERLGVTTPRIGITHFHLGSLHYQWNEFEIAEKHFSIAAGWGERSGIFDISLNATFGLIELACSRGEKEKARNAVEKFQSLMRQANLESLESVRIVSRALEAYYDLRLGKLDNALRWASISGLTFEDQPDISLLEPYLIYTAIRLGESRKLGIKTELPRIVQFLDLVIQQAEAATHIHYLIRAYIYRALALDLLGETKAGMQSLHSAMELAQQGNILRVFLNQGEPMRQLLEKALSYRKHLIFIRRLLVAFAEETTTRGEETAKSVPSSLLPETLTSREFEILQLIAAGLSNKAIEEKLVISKNTVRTHIKNLYSKLGVSNRTQAVLRARESGLL